MNLSELCQIATSSERLVAPGARLLSLSRIICVRRCFANRHFYSKRLVACIARARTVSMWHVSEVIHRYQQSDGTQEDALQSETLRFVCVPLRSFRLLISVNDFTHIPYGFRPCDTCDKSFPEVAIWRSIDDGRIQLADTCERFPACWYGFSPVCVFRSLVEWPFLANAWCTRHKVTDSRLCAFVSVLPKCCFFWTIYRTYYVTWL